MMRPARNKPIHSTGKDKTETGMETLQYEWSKGYLPTENPKFDEPNAEDPFK